MLGYKFGYRLKRLKVKWRQWKKSLDKRISPVAQNTSPYQEKAIRLWKLVLKDTESKLAVNTYGVRQIDRDNLLLVFQYSDGNSDSILTIMDITENGNNLYELNIPPKQSITICNYFDDEMDRRMNKVETTKRNIIETDLDKLVDFQDMQLKKQKDNQ
jgi:hypothetical protein